MLINADLKQIEVIIFAHLSGDKVIQELIKNNIDIHRYIGSMIYDKKMEEISDKERKEIKTAVFGIIYGNGALGLSKAINKSEDWCRNFINDFYEMFPQAKEWHNKILKIVEKSGELKLFTGFRFKFNKYPAKFSWQIAKGIKNSYNPPEIKNYPVQHTAFLIMSLILGEFFRTKALLNRDKYLLINTVHDSIMLDCKEDYITDAITDLTEVVDNIPQIVYNEWNEQINLPIKIDISIGNNWQEL